MRDALSAYAGADAAAGRPDLQVAEPPLGRLVDRDVPRHDQVRVAGDDDDRRIDAARLELVELVEQHLRVDDAAGADHRGLARDDAARRLADLERLVADDDRVPGVRPALVAADDIGLLGEQVDDLALALVAPLRPDDHGRGHGVSLRVSGTSRPASSRMRRGELPRDPPNDDAVAAPAGREADVGLAAQRAVNEQQLDGERLSQRQARLARLFEGRRLRAEPDVLPLDHVSCSCLSSGACERGRALDAAEEDLVARGAAGLG